MKISTIIPIYNVEDYISKTIDSVIAQDIGFLDNIEIILVDDGSPDNSGAICRKYVEKYPDNIQYIKQENAGVSAARNNGLKYAKGEYIHFLDSDDIISKNAYSSSLAMLEDNKSVNMSAMRVEFFEGQLGEHPLNYKFTDDRVVDLNKEPNNPVLHMSSCIIRRKSIKYEFDSTIKISEDMKFLTEFLKDSPSYALIASATYYYRKRAVGGSAIDGSQKNRDFYLVTPYKVYEYLFDLWRTDTNTVHPYVQYTVAYDLQWRIRQASQAVLSNEEERRYKETIYSLIKRIDDQILFDQRFLSIAQLAFMLKIKHKKFSKQIIDKLEALVAKTRIPVRIDFIERHKNNVTRIEGWIPGASDFHEVRASVGGVEQKVIYTENVHRRKTFLGDLVYSGRSFYLDISSNTIGDIKFYDKSNKQVGVITKRQSGIPDKKYAYRVDGDRTYVNQNESISIYESSTLRTMVFEMRWMLRILASLKLRKYSSQLKMILKSTLKSEISLYYMIAPFLVPAGMIFENLSHIIRRLMYFITKPLARKPVWIVSDRFIAAGDNGEALFDFVFEKTPGDIDFYFAIDKKSKDFHRLRKKYKKHVIDSSSWRYQLLFLHSSKIISSHADDVVINPFGEYADYYYDLYKFDFIFLQHGIIRNDMSSWLNRFNKNIKLFITSAEPEYNSILNYKYYYDQSRILLSGLPRYDLLESKPKNKLILSPTWRHSLALPPDPVSGKRPYNKSFKDSEYYTFFNSLMNDPRVRDALRAANMVGEFYIHPALESQARDFNSNDVFTIKDFPYDYRTAFKEGSIMVTDYSSVLFDFAYLRKPVIYTQFDADSFYGEQTIYTKGYMDDETDGFGPVAYDLEDSVKKIINSIESKAKMDVEYKDRVDSFFRWHDRNSRERVYRAVRDI